MSKAKEKRLKILYYRYKKLTNISISGLSKYELIIKASQLKNERSVTHDKVFRIKYETDNISEKDEDFLKSYEATKDEVDEQIELLDNILNILETAH